MFQKKNGNLNGTRKRKVNTNPDNTFSYFDSMEQFRNIYYV